MLLNHVYQCLSNCEARFPKKGRGSANHVFYHNNKNTYTFKYYKFDIYLFMGGAIVFFIFRVV